MGFKTRFAYGLLRWKQTGAGLRVIARDRLKEALVGIFGCLLAVYLQQRYSLLTTSVMSVVIPIVSFLLFGLAYRFLFTAPRELHEKCLKNGQRLQAEVDELRGVGRTQSLLNAINYVQEKTAFGRTRRYGQVLAEFMALALDGRLHISGRLAKQYPFSLFPDAETFPSQIPANFFVSCEYKNVGPLKTLALEENISDEMRESAQRSGKYIFKRTYYEPTVSIDVVKSLFDTRND